MLSSCSIFICTRSNHRFPSILYFNITRITSVTYSSAIYLLNVRWPLVRPGIKCWTKIGTVTSSVNLVFSRELCPHPALTALTLNMNVLLWTLPRCLQSSFFSITLHTPASGDVNLITLFSLEIHDGPPLPTEDSLIRCRRLWHGFLFFSLQPHLSALLLLNVSGIPVGCYRSKTLY